MKKIDASKLPVMKNYCDTCPFKPDAKGRPMNPKLAGEVITRTLLQGHQICHGTEGKNRKPHNRCKGAFDYNAEIYNRLGVAQLLK